MSGQEEEGVFACLLPEHLPLIGHHVWGTPTNAFARCDAVARLRMRRVCKKWYAADRDFRTPPGFDVAADLKTIDAVLGTIQQQSRGWPELAPRLVRRFHRQGAEME
jgi:hypothetical protein